MTERPQDIDHILKTTLPRPAPREMAAALDRAYDRLRLGGGSNAESSSVAFEGERRFGWRGVTGVGLIAAASVLAVVYVGRGHVSLHPLSGAANDVASAARSGDGDSHPLETYGLQILPVSASPESSGTGYVVQVAAFASAEEADAVVNALQSANMPPTITEDMRAVSVRVTEVAGVAGFIVPGAHVDVLVVLRPDGQRDSITKVVLRDVQVLTAGTRDNQENDRGGQPIYTTVVTLLLTPTDAETLARATHDGSIVVMPRDPTAQKPAETNGARAEPLLEKGVSAYVVPVVSAGQSIYLVHIGQFATLPDAQASAAKLRQIVPPPWMTTTSSKKHDSTASLPR